MDILFTALALILPILLGSLWLNLLIPAQTLARKALVLSHGTLIGLLLIPQFMRAMDGLGIALSFGATAWLTGILIVRELVANANRAKRAPLLPPPAPVFAAMPGSHQALFIFLLLLLFLRCATLGLEVLWRPLFPWDATMHWATKARVWFEYKSMLPFVDNDLWLQLNDKGVFTDRHPDYPPTIPLLQVWMNLATGRWDESLMNLPWLLCYMALGAAFYGQLRVSGVGALTALAFTYLLLSMPLLNIHVALAGYADLFLGAAYCAGLMAFHNWVKTGQCWQGLLAAGFVLSCMLIKNEGVLWSMTLIPALLFTVQTRYKTAKILLLLSLIAVLLAILIHKNPLIVAGILDRISDYHADGLIGTIKTLWLHDNWHLFGYLLLAIIPLDLLLPVPLKRGYLGLGVALACAVGLFLMLFLFTDYGEGAANFTGVGRLGIQLIPGLLFLCAMLCNELLTRDRQGVLRQPA